MKNNNKKYLINFSDKKYECKKYECKKCAISFIHYENYLIHLECNHNLKKRFCC